jgi:type VI protein secretion system component Hcp
MDVTSAQRPWRLLVLPLVVIALALGWLAVQEQRPSSPAPQFTFGDLLLAATTANDPIFLNYGGVTGTPSSTHTNDAKLSSVAFAITRQITRGPGGAPGVGPTVFGDVTVHHSFDKYSTGFFRALAIGSSSNAALYFAKVNVRGVLVNYLEIDLKNTLISKDQWSSSGDTPVETISINYGSIEFKTSATGAPQTVSVG